MAIIETFLCVFCADADTDSNPQTLLFSATLPHWVHETAKKYLRPDRKHLDLVCDDAVKTSKTVRVRADEPVCVPYWTAVVAGFVQSNV